MIEQGTMHVLAFMNVLSSKHKIRNIGRYQPQETEKHWFLFRTYAQNAVGRENRKTQNASPGVMVEASKSQFGIQVLINDLKLLAV